MLVLLLLPLATADPPSAANTATRPGAVLEVIDSIPLLQGMTLAEVKQQLGPSFRKPNIREFGQYHLVVQMRSGPCLHTLYFFKGRLEPTALFDELLRSLP